LIYRRYFSTLYHYPLWGYCFQKRPNNSSRSKKPPNFRLTKLKKKTIFFFDTGAILAITIASLLVAAVSAQCNVNSCTYESAVTPSANVTFTTAGYVPPCMKVAVGGVINWSGSFTSHPLTAGLGGATPQPTNTTSPFYPPTNTGTTLSLTFPTAGVYPFYCSNHPSSMIGVVYVGTGCAAPVAAPVAAAPVAAPVVSAPKAATAPTKSAGSAVIVSFGAVAAGVVVALAL
jgi:plastocyanin